MLCVSCKVCLYPEERCCAARLQVSERRGEHLLAAGLSAEAGAQTSEGRHEPGDRGELPVLQQQLRDPGHRVQSGRRGQPTGASPAVCI